MPKDAPLPAAPSGAQQPAEAFDMVFHCQLAHGSPTKQIRDFTNVKQLYEAIAKAFGLSTGDILYCTLNTHKVDMTRLLGGQIGLDDFLFAHVKGQSKPVKVVKDGPALGLTISDNGAGYAFIKKIRDDSIMSRVNDVNVGDHISNINGTDLTGCRHFEVARMLKEIPIGSEFTLTVVEPKKAFDEVAGMKPRGQASGTGEVKAGAGKKTLRMKRDGNAVVEDVPTDAVVEVVNKIDDLLENFVGIKDQELSTTIYDLAKASKEADLFAGQLDEQLADFEFPDDFVLDVFEMVHK
ncbi:GIPC PDZ domain-containing protein [Salpingoeca rosetta]|uniref:GIPC PDZ domain-containing protein n=1 Tax=Salpingoeca rosetta (strain ATCC 50818 / BSB-021) TaxID=946362 RepID=F2UQF5_SALR5|nr:GIPC PDZ domain-containing protein [Salpingoeca rosetta]EGD79860.1 GIPC PDZ domain-containing protein [Salpingoeca rosetta]|eukprot:XP_004988481.1 GIPC PDZ domain-containing protein [Salpingoeca rosetta]